MTISVTGICVGLAVLTNRYYRRVFIKARELDVMLGELPTVGERNMAEPDPSDPTAAILVGGYGGLGIHTLLGETSVFLLDLAGGLQTGPHRLVAKFVQQPVLGGV